MASNWGFRSITLVCFGLLTPRSRSLLLKIEIQFPLNNFSMLWPIDTKLGACHQWNQNNGTIFSSRPSFISYSCHINTWLNRWKPGFVALRIPISNGPASVYDNIGRCPTGVVIYLPDIVLCPAYFTWKKHIFTCNDLCKYIKIRYHSSKETGC